MQARHGSNSPAKAYLFAIAVAFTFIAEIINLPHSFAATYARDLIFQPLWIYRAVLGDFSIIIALSFYEVIWSDVALPWYIPKIPETRVTEAQVFGFLILLMGSAGMIAWRGEDAKGSADEKEYAAKDDFLIPPLLIPGRTTHSRMFPQKHSFSYSYFSVGVPVGLKGRSGSAISTNLECLDKGKRRRGWFHIDASDYLYRGGPELGLEDRLRKYLRGEGVEDDTWSFAYLITAPKFLRYSFNPVSFWYIYDNEETLSMMVLEVNNTFGERRIYLLKSQGRADDESMPDELKAPPKSIRFTNAWEKDFHVSPFNSRKGTYSLTATDPLSMLKSGSTKILDNTIVLNSSKAHAKLVARLFSEGEPKDPAMLTTFELTRILLSWFWVGFLTFPRIVTQAYALYFKRNLHVWFRPEVLATSLGRAHTSTEKILESFFRLYLSSMVENASEAMKLTYVPPGSISEPIILTSKTTTTNTTPKEMTLKVLSPGFFARFVHYAHSSEALDREGLCPDPKNRTLLISNSEHLPLLLRTPTSKHSTSNLGPLDRLRWSLLTKLRCPPPEYAYPEPKDETTTSITHTITDIRTLPPSRLDLFVLGLTHNEATIYRRTVTRVFVAQRYTFGFEGLVSLLDFLFRAVIILLWFRIDKKGMRMQRGGETMGIYGQRVGMWVLGNGIHLWAFAKGGLSYNRAVQAE